MRNRTILDNFRSRRRAWLTVLTPLLALSWIGAAATPCAGMAADSGRDAGHVHAQLDSGDVTHHAHPAGQGSTDGAAHPVCPHCAHAPSGSSAGDAAAHAGCGTVDANATSDTQRVFGKHDLGVAPPVQARTAVVTRATAACAALDPGERPVPAPARYLQYCVFLN